MACQAHTPILRLCPAQRAIKRRSAWWIAYLLIIFNGLFPVRYVSIL